MSISLKGSPRPFKVLGMQQVAIGGPSKAALRRLWVDTFGLEVTSTFRSERENVDEDICAMGAGPFKVEVDLMEPIDPAGKPAVHATPLNHIGLWIDDLRVAVAWLEANGVRMAPGGIRVGAAGFDICFVHPKGNDAFPIGGEGVLIELVQAPPDVIEALSTSNDSASAPARPIRLHAHALSGHSHRVELMLHLLGLPFEIAPIDFMRGDHKAPAFLELNLFGQVPVIEDGGTVIADSNAILVYLATRYDPTCRWYPRDAVTAAAVQRWLSVAAGQLAYGPALARATVVFGRPVDQRPRDAAARLFAQLEAHLAIRKFLAAPHATIADLAVYAYCAHAPEGGVSLASYPALLAWIARVEALPAFVGMTRSNIPDPTA